MKFAVVDRRAEICVKTVVVEGRAGNNMNFQWWME
jgi:hypothetical protein